MQTTHNTHCCQTAANIGYPPPNCCRSVRQHRSCILPYNLYVFYAFLICWLNRDYALVCAFAVGQIRVRNLTYMQPFSPILFVAHTKVSLLLVVVGVERLEVNYFPKTDRNIVHRRGSLVAPEVWWLPSDTTSVAMNRGVQISASSCLLLCGTNKLVTRR